MILVVLVLGNSIFLYKPVCAMSICYPKFTTSKGTQFCAAPVKCLKGRCRRRQQHQHMRLLQVYSRKKAIIRAALFGRDEAR